MTSDPFRVNPCPATREPLAFSAGQDFSPAVTNGSYRVGSRRQADYQPACPERSRGAGRVGGNHDDRSPATCDPCPAGPTIPRHLLTPTLVGVRSRAVVSWPACRRQGLGTTGARVLSFRAPKLRGEESAFPPPPPSSAPDRSPTCFLTPTLVGVRSQGSRRQAGCQPAGRVGGRADFLFSLFYSRFSLFGDR